MACVSVAETTSGIQSELFLIRMPSSKQIEQKAVTGSTSITLKRGLVTISGNLNDEVPKGTLNSIMKQSGLKEVEIDD